MLDRAADIARRLAEQAEAVCRHYLSSGFREGRYWLVGDADNNPGHSLFVRLKAGEAGKLPGKWTDAAKGEHGDLLDIIARRESLTTLRETPDEARRFLALPRAEPTDTYQHQLPAPTGSPEAARRLFAMSKPIAGTLAETYLRERGITGARTCTALRFHPRCWHRSDDDPADSVRDSWPALIAAVTDNAGIITGAHRTWLDPSCKAKAPISTPRRAMGVAPRQTASGSVGHRTSWRPAKASRRCCRYDASCPPCRWSRRSPPTTLPPCSCRTACAGDVGRTRTRLRDRGIAAHARAR